MDMKADQTIWVNDRMYEIFGHARADGALSRRQFVERDLHADDVAAFEGARKNALRSGGNFHIICRIKQKNGSRRSLQLDGKFEFAPDGEPLTSAWRACGHHRAQGARAQDPGTLRKIDNASGGRASAHRPRIARFHGPTPGRRQPHSMGLRPKRETERRPGEALERG